MLEESRLPLVHCIPVASITVFVFSTRPWLRRGGKSGLQESQSGRYETMGQYAGSNIVLGSNSLLGAVFFILKITKGR